MLSRFAAAVLRNRRLVRAPIWLYRHGLGRLLGERMLMLEHVGRSSGRARYVILEVIGHPGADRYLVVSGFGERSQWFRNVTAESRVQVSTGRRDRVPAVATVLPRERADAALSSYTSEHPRAWRNLRSAMERLGTDTTRLPVVALDLAG